MAKRKGMLPTAPLVPVLRAALRSESCVSLARRAGLHDSNLNHIANGTWPNVTEETADRLLTLGLGRPDLFSTLYPQEEYHG